MITKSQKKKLQKYLKKDWVPEVFHELRKLNVTSSRGTEYSESMIRMVFIGKIEHKGIEQAIFKVFENRKTDFQDHERKKEQILRNE